MLRLLVRMRRYASLRLTDFDDNDVGEPSAFLLPRDLAGAAGLVVSRFTGRARNGGRHVYRLTEAQMRYAYFRSRIACEVGSQFGTVVEVGGGFGGLAAELLRRMSIGRYFLVELPDAIPLASYYLRARFDCGVQVLCDDGGTVDPHASIVILTPWMLPAVTDAVDLVINTASFQHMDQENLEFYFGEIRRLAPARMFLVNRNVPRDPTDVIIDEYPIPGRYGVVSDRQFPFYSYPVRERVYAPDESSRV